jgi:RNA polymerase sigma-70 factor (ECF subfamily)
MLTSRHAAAYTLVAVAILLGLLLLGVGVANA